MDDQTATAAVAAESDLAARFADVSRHLLSAPTTVEVLRRIVQLAVRTIDGCDYAGILLPAPTGPGTAAQTAPVVYSIDQDQLTTGEGPCLVFRERVTLTGQRYSEIMLYVVDCVRGGTAAGP